MDKRNLPDDKREIRCPKCNAVIPVGASYCAACQHPLDCEEKPSTSLLTRHPVAMPLERQGSAVLAPDCEIILQLLPSGTCLTVPLADVAVLGRSPAPQEDNLVDLTAYHGYQRGVSRRHCQLIRRADRLMVMDLGSSNGTYLNSESLLAHREYPIADGDKLILGSLHVIVSFSHKPR